MGPHQGKAYGKTMQDQAALQLVRAAYGTQFGDIPGKSAEPTSRIVHPCVKKGKHKGWSVVELFIDLDDDNGKAEEPAARARHHCRAREAE